MRNANCHTLTSYSQTSNDGIRDNNKNNDEVTQIELDISKAQPNDVIENTKRIIKQKDDLIKFHRDKYDELLKKRLEQYDIKQIIEEKDNCIKSLKKNNDELLKKNEYLERNFNCSQKIYYDLQSSFYGLKEEVKHWEESYREAKQRFDSELSGYKKRYKKLQQNHEFVLSVLEKQNMKASYEDDIKVLEPKQKRSLKRTQEEYNELNQLINTLQQELNKKGDDLRKLEEENTKLRKEASKYQSKLGNVMNVRLDDKDSVKFRQEILDLQKTLENYVTNLKPNIDVNIGKIQVIAQKYGFSTAINLESKSFTKALLQRKVLDDIFELFHESKYKSGEAVLELDIESKVQDLLSSIEKFSTSRVGTDEIVNVAAIKVRQQVYGILSNRGFSDIIGPYGNRMHDFIISVSDNLNNIMNQYRKINDVNKKKEVELIAPKLIQDVYKLFLFRLKVQEPIIEVKFFEKNIKIDPKVMRERWDDDEIDQLYVGICYFPLIGENLESPDRKIYTPAMVFPRKQSC